MDIREIPLNDALMELSEFEANGSKYIIVKKTNLSIDRYQHLHGYSEQIIRATSNKPMVDLLKQMASYLRQGNHHDLSLLVDRNMESSQLNKNFPETVLNACTSFIIKEGEDVKTYNPELTESKIEDWKASEYPFEAFFFLTLKYSVELAKIWNYFFQIVSKNQSSKEVQDSSQSTKS